MTGLALKWYIAAKAEELGISPEMYLANLDLDNRRCATCPQYCPTSPCSKYATCGSDSPFPKRKPSSKPRCCHCQYCILYGDWCYCLKKRWPRPFALSTIVNPNKKMREHFRACDDFVWREE